MECLCWQCDKACDANRCSWSKNRLNPNSKYVESKSGVVITECDDFEPEQRGHQIKWTPGVISLCESLLKDISANYYNDVLNGRPAVSSKKTFKDHWIWEYLDPLGTGKVDEVCETVHARATRAKLKDRLVDIVMRRILMESPSVTNLKLSRELCVRKLKEVEGECLTENMEDEIEMTINACIKYSKKSEQRKTLNSVINQIDNEISKRSGVSA